MNPTDTQQLEVIEPSAIEAVSRAEIDVAITTSKKYPRDIQKVKQSMLSFATLDVETAEACFYSLPRGGKTIQGPSVRLAEIAVSCYGNLRAGSRITSVVASGDAPHVVVQAVAMDLEKNISISIEKRRRITKKKFKDAIDEDDINLAANACSAICFRDAVFKVIPLALIKPIFEAAKKVAVGDAKTLSDRRIRCMETFAKMGLKQDRVLAKVDCRSIEQITLEHLETLMGLYNAVRDGELNIDEAFPAIVATAAATPFERSQHTGGPALPSEAPALTPTPKTPTAPESSANAIPGAATTAIKRRGRPPGSRSAVEKFTPQEADEIRAQGIAVAPSAVEGEAEDSAQQGEPQQDEGEQNAEQVIPEEEKALADAGLAPEPEPEPAAAPAFKPTPGESQAVTAVRKLCFESKVTEEQVMKFMQVNKLSSGEAKLTDFTANTRENKLVALARSWGVVLPRIKAQKTG